MSSHCREKWSCTSLHGLLQAATCWYRLCTALAIGTEPPGDSLCGLQCWHQFKSFWKFIFGIFCLSYTGQLWTSPKGNLPKMMWQDSQNQGFWIVSLRGNWKIKIFSFTENQTFFQKVWFLGMYNLTGIVWADGCNASLKLGKEGHFCLQIHNFTLSTLNSQVNQKNSPDCLNTWSDHSVSSLLGL